jgi:adenylate cyclase
MQGPINPEDGQPPFARRSPPTSEDIRAQLERIIASPEFPGAGHGHAFLRYVVDETLSGRAERIKGYSIAIEVFNREEGFSQDDPVVRIEAGRLRRTLERYYLVAGQNDPVVINIPKGKYVPFFTWNGSMAEPGGVDAESLPKPSTVADVVPLQRTPMLVLSALSVLVCIGLLAYWILGPPTSEVSARSGIASPEGPTLVIAPFANLGEGPDAKLYALGLTEELLTVLPRFKELKVFGRETSETLPPEIAPSHIRGNLGARYLLAGGVRVSDRRVRVTARLLDTNNDAILWSQTYDDDLRSRGLFAIQSDVADRVATAVAQPYGIIAQADAANPPPDDLDAYGCTLRFYAYRAELSVEKHAEVRECLESAVARYPSYATAWAMLSIVYLDEDRFKYNLRSGSPAPLERSLTTARRAVELDPGNTRALQALMTALFFNQQLAESLRVGEQALATNPNDTELMGEYGTRLALGGQWGRGAALLQQALFRNPGGGGYYHGMRALAAYMLQDNDTAVDEIRQANLQKFPLFHLIAAVIYAERGMMEDAKREGATFVEMRPAFLANLSAELKIRNIPPQDQVRMIAGIRKAGLPVPADTAASISSPSAGSDLQPQ